MDWPRTALYSLVVVGIGIYWWSAQEPPVTPVKKAKPKPSATLIANTDFDQADFDARFAKPKVKLRNLFLPLVLSPQQKTANAQADKQDILKIPPNYAEGDPNWAFTGFAIVNGDRMALLENSAKHEAGYVKEGETWKKSKIRRITSESIVLVDEDGEEQVVLRYTSFVKPKPEDQQPVTPLNLGPALSGPIGPNNIRIVPNMPGRVIRMLPGVQP